MLQIWTKILCFVQGHLLLGKSSDSFKYWQVVFTPNTACRIACSQKQRSWWAILHYTLTPVAFIKARNFRT